MSQAVGDKAAIQFAVGFYDALGAGWSYEDAYELGCNAIAIEGISLDALKLAILFFPHKAFENFQVQCKCV